MELLLNNKDLEALIHDAYDGVESIKFSKEVKVTITIDSNKIMKKSKKNISVAQQPVSEPTPIDAEEMNRRLEKVGGMAVGGERRNLMKFG